MNVEVAAMRAEWEALKLKLLIPAKLTDDDFALALFARTEPANRAFREVLPLTVAKFKETSKALIMNYEDIIRENRNSYAEKIHFPDQSDFWQLPSQSRGDLRYAYEQKIAHLYQEDIKKIHTILFAGTTQGPEIDAQVQASARYGQLHVDGSGGHRYIATYIARVGALPSYCISGNQQLNASQEIQDLIQKASRDCSDRYTSQLRDRKILTPLPLGDVGLLLSSSKYRKDGTLHCSSPPPRNPTYSVFFRVFGTFPVQGLA